MTHQRDIIEVVKELRAKSCECDKYETCNRCIEKAEAFPDIASALLTKDEQLRIAVEALEKYYGWMNGGKKQSAYGRIVDKALSRISSL